MKLRIVWIAGLLLAAFGQAAWGWWPQPSLVTVVSFGPGAPRCAPANITIPTLPICAAGTSFQVLSFSSGASLPNSTTPTTQRVGKQIFSVGQVDLSDISMQKALDDTSTGLLMDLLGGTHIPAMRLTTYRINGTTATPIYEIVMQEVFVTSLSDSASQGSSFPVQSLSVAVGSIAVSVTTFDSTGTPSTTTATFSRLSSRL